MISVTRLSIYNNFKPNTLIVEFDLNDTMENLDDYQINLQRSDSDDNTFFTIEYDLQENVFEDTNINTRNQRLFYYYRLEIMNRKSGETSYTDPTTDSIVSTDKYGKAIYAYNKMYLEKVIRNEFFLLRKIRSGQKCSCYDDIRGKSRTKNCNLCFGTGFFKGYYTKKKIFANIANSKQVQESMEHSGINEINNPLSIWTEAFPILRHGDILVDSLNNRYSIMSIERTSKGNFLLRQVINIQKIDNSSIIYKIPLGGELKCI